MTFHLIKTEPAQRGPDEAAERPPKGVGLLASYLVRNFKPDLGSKPFIAIMIMI
jgi:hypothetical protein